MEPAEKPEDKPSIKATGPPLLLFCSDYLIQLKDILVDLSDQASMLGSVCGKDLDRHGYANAMHALANAHWWINHAVDHVLVLGAPPAAAETDDGCCP